MAGQPDLYAAPSKLGMDSIQFNTKKLLAQQATVAFIVLFT